MTCIIGLEHDGYVYIGGDSAAVGGWTTQPIRHPKVFHNGDFILGYTTSFRMGELLQYQWKPPEYNDDITILEFMHTDVIESIRQTFKDFGYSRIENNKEKGGSFLIGFKDSLFGVDSDFQIKQMLYEFTACGSGQDVALGAMYVLSQKHPDTMILKALKASAQFQGGVMPPFHIVSTNPEFETITA